MLLYIVRHGEPDYVTDTLTENGIIQAEAVGKRIAASGINVIYSSPMGRARQTAAPACRLLGLPCNIEEWAHEVEDERLTPYPDGKLKSISVIQNTVYRENGNILLPYERAYECTAIDQTQMKTKVAEIERNGNAFLERLGYKEENGVYRILRPNEDKVALFCHTVFARSWLSTLLHIPIHIMWSGFVHNFTGVTVVEFKNNPDGYTAPRLLCYSDMSHFYGEGLSMTYENRFDI